MIIAIVTGAVGLAALWFVRRHYKRLLLQAHRDMGDMRIDRDRAQHLADMAAPTYHAVNEARLAMQAADGKFTNLVKNLRQRLYTQSLMLEKFAAQQAPSEAARTREFINTPLPTLEDMQ